MCQILYNSEKPDTFVYLMGTWFGEKHNIYNGERRISSINGAG